MDGFGASFTCVCGDGWQGKTCDDNVNECDGNPCLNGGMCMDTPGSFICGCPTGKRSEKPDILYYDYNHRLDNLLKSRLYVD